MPGRICAQMVSGTTNDAANNDHGRVGRRPRRPSATCILVIATPAKCSAVCSGKMRDWVIIPQSVRDQKRWPSVDIPVAVATVNHCST